MNIQGSIGTLLLVLASLVAGAQDPYADAFTSYGKGELAVARGHIDLAVTDARTAKDAGVWLLRGFIYKDVFKGMAPGPEADVVRDEAVASLHTCMQLDVAGKYRKDAVPAFEFLTRTYYNDAARALNQMDAARAQQLFAKYKEAQLRLEPRTDLKPRDIEFQNALGTVYTKRYAQDRRDTTWYYKAEAVYLRVLELDPANYGAQYNLATLHYNRGVYNIQQISPENDIPSIQDIQRVSRHFFQKALPFMLKAHDMNPRRKETLLGLEGIYYSLQDQEKSDHYRKLYDALEAEDER